MHRTLLTVGLLALGLTALGGCGDRMTVPEGFVELDAEHRGIYDQRAVSADGVVLAVRRIDVEGSADADFWARAVANRLTQARGYTLESSEPLARAGRRAPHGRLLRFTAPRDGAPHVYLVALYAQPSHVLLAEAGGPRDAFAPIEPQVRDALRSVR